jgi:hypothetical protein
MQIFRYVSLCLLSNTKAAEVLSAMNLSLHVLTKLHTNMSVPSHDNVIIEGSTEEGPQKKKCPS